MFGRGNAYRIDLGIAIMPLPSNEYWSCSGQGINGGTCGGCYYERRSRTYFGSAGEMNFIVSEGGRYVWFDSAAFTGKTNLFSTYLGNCGGSKTWCDDQSSMFLHDRYSNIFDVQTGTLRSIAAPADSVNGTQFVAAQRPIPQVFDDGAMWFDAVGYYPGGIVSLAGPIYAVEKMKYYHGAYGVFDGTTLTDQVLVLQGNSMPPYASGLATATCADDASLPE